MDDKVTTAVKAVSGQIWSRRDGIMFAGNVDRIDETLKEIEEEQSIKDKKIEEKEQKNSLGRKNTGVIIFVDEK